MDVSDQLNHLRRIALRKIALQIIENLLIVERQDQISAVIAGSDGLAILPHQQRPLVGDGAEIVTAAGHQQLADRVGPVGRRGDWSCIFIGVPLPMRRGVNAPQRPGKILTLLGTEMHQHLIQPIENHQRRVGAHPVDQFPRLELVRVVGALEQLFDNRLNGKFAQPLCIHPAQIEIQRQRQRAALRFFPFRVDLIGEHLATHCFARAVLPQQRAKRRRGLILHPFDQSRNQIHPRLIGAGG